MKGNAVSRDTGKGGECSQVSMLQGIAPVFTFDPCREHFVVQLSGWEKG